MGLLNDKVALFAGPTAETWDWKKYTEAVDMKVAGAKPEDIRQKTGIWWGPDGKPRMEIDDSAAVVGAPGKGNLDSLLNHDELYKAYPALRAAEVDLKKAGFFDSPLEGSYEYPSSPDRPAGKITLKAAEGRMKEGMLHEVQHAIQGREGFDPGGLPRGMELKEAQTSYEASQRYLRVMGEAEARATSARRDMTAAERLKSPPEKSYDVPINELTKR